MKMSRVIFHLRVKERNDHFFGNFLEKDVLPQKRFAEKKTLERGKIQQGQQEGSNPRTHENPTADIAN
jgi:hypothetical protein